MLMFSVAGSVGGTQVSSSQLPLTTMGIPSIALQKLLEYFWGTFSSAKEKLFSKIRDVANYTSQKKIKKHVAREENCFWCGDKASRTEARTSSCPQRGKKNRLCAVESLCFAQKEKNISESWPSANAALQNCLTVGASKWGGKRKNFPLKKHSEGNWCQVVAEKPEEGGGGERRRKTINQPQCKKCQRGGLKKGVGVGWQWMGKGVYNRRRDLKRVLKDFMMRGWEAQKRWRWTGLLPATHSAAEESSGLAGVSVNKLALRTGIRLHHCMCWWFLWRVY